MKKATVKNTKEVEFNFEAKTEAPKKCACKAKAAKAPKAPKAEKKESAPAGKRVKFVFNGNPGSKVYLVGSFNDWLEGHKLMTDKNNTGEYTCTCMIKPGRYEYKFLVDDVWMMDINNPNFVKNIFGSLNNILEV